MSFTSAVKAETYVCAYNCYLQKEKICQDVYKRIENGFKDRWSKYTANENDQYIILSDQYLGEDGAGVKIAIINKKTMKFLKSNTEHYSEAFSKKAKTDHNANYRSGTCIRND